MADMNAAGAVRPVGVAIAGEGDDQNPLLIPEHLRIEAFEDWLERNGLRAPADNEETEDIHEERVRVQQGNDYEALLHKQYFADYEQEQEEMLRERQKVLRQIEAAKITLISEVSTNETVVAPLFPLASTCDTIYALVASWDIYNTDQVENKEVSPHNQDRKAISLSLPFSRRALERFVDLISGILKLSDLLHAEENSECKASCEDQLVDEHAIIECTRLAHYLQHASILEDCVNILMDAIDTENCLAISQLADQLHIPRLFERAISHMMDSMENVSQVLDQGEQEDGLTKELRQRIEAIQTAIRTSLHSTSRNQLYFSSLEEYIAIFAERVQYYKERLMEAEEQQMQRPRNFGRGWHDAQIKIERQKIRVETLETALKEQKKMFSRIMQSKDG